MAQITNDLSAIRPGNISLLRVDSSEEEKLRALQDLERKIALWTEAMAAKAKKFEAQNQALFTEGEAGPGLRAGMLAYQTGRTWLPAIASDVNKWARGVVLSVAGKKCTIQHAGVIKMAVGGIYFLPTTLWLSATVPGLATTTRPVIGSSLVFQEVGLALDYPDVAKGLVLASINLRVEPEK